ncbi:MAG: acyl-CoA synthetase [Gemmatimonadota bacterium]|nr:acyl-CoA synthetase [Gemmatimonadota bacterium]
MATHTFLEPRSFPIAHDANTLPARIARPACSDRTALIDGESRWTYADLLDAATTTRDRLVEAARTSRPPEPAPARSLGAPPGSPDESLAGERVAYLIPPGGSHVAVQLGTWLARGVAVPLAVSHPPPELEYVLEDAQPSIVVLDPALPHSAALATTASARGIPILEVHGTAPPPRPASRANRADLPPPHPTDPAFILYTSGTTGRPKGVVSTHQNVTAQITALTTAWAWHESDRILHTLPLHHVHGLVNALACALWSGATCEFGRGAPASTWERFASGDITLFMAVPTVYARLIRAWEDAPRSTRQRWARGARRLRLMVAGSAALPVATFHRWREITGHTLLERYGMTEIGMALSNPLEGERRAGHVGHPLPGVEVRIVDGDGQPVRAGAQGEIVIRGPQVFREYWRRPRETDASFRDGWFRTGDEGRVGHGGYHRILGRRSVDIVKTGGYKVSALEVEELYRTHRAIRDLAVVGVPDPEWGERICAAWVAADGFGPVDGPTLRAWGKERLAPYKVPHNFLPVGDLPRNAMGKVRKDAVSRMFTPLPQPNEEPA